MEAGDGEDEDDWARRNGALSNFSKSVDFAQLAARPLRLTDVSNYIDENELVRLGSLFTSSKILSKEDYRPLKNEEIAEASNDSKTITATLNSDAKACPERGQAAWSPTKGLLGLQRKPPEGILRSGRQFRGLGIDVREFQQARLGGGDVARRWRMRTGVEPNEPAVVSGLPLDPQ